MKEIKKELIVDEELEMEPAAMQASQNGCSACSVGSLCLLTPTLDAELVGLLGLFGLKKEEKEYMLAVDEMAF